MTEVLFSLGGGTCRDGASIRDIKSCETAVFFAEEVDAYVYTEIPGAATAECAVTLHGIINGKLWDGVYIMIAEAEENGVFAFKMKRKGVQHEEVAFWDFCNMVRWGTGDMDSRHTVSITFRDESGNILETYEEVFARA